MRIGCLTVVPCFVLLAELRHEDRSLRIIFFCFKYDTYRMLKHTQQTLLHKTQWKHNFFQELEQNCAVPIHSVLYPSVET